MLKQWLQKRDDADKDKAATQPSAPTKRPADEDPQLPRDLTDEEKQAEKDAAIRRKLREASREGPATPNNSTSYDSLFRASQRIMMEAAGDQPSDGFQVNTSHHVQNAQLQTKFQFGGGNPQMGNGPSYEVDLQMNSFSDVMSVGYSTLGRWQLMYQRVFKSGALFVGQFMVQPAAAAMGGPPGTLYAMLQYPWVNGGCSQMAYLRGQHVNVSHAQRLIRGLHVGANMTYDLGTKSTTMAYCASTTSHDKSRNWVAEVKPDSGEWKVAATKRDWASDTEFGVQLDYAEKRSPMGGSGVKASTLSMSMRRPLIGGGTFAAVLTGFQKLKASLELPFGCERLGANQIMLGYNTTYDVNTGALKHGLTLSI